MKPKKICVVTGSRAEFHLLKYLILELKREKNLSTSLLVTGSHNSRIFGKTINEIKKSNIKINTKIDISLFGDSPNHISKSFSICIKKVSAYFNKTKPDLIVILGDRYEIFACAIAACFNQIPIAHIHGGESTEGLIDEAIRHSLTKLSHLHFVSTKKYFQRVNQLGENKKNIFLVGSLGVEAIKKYRYINKKILQDQLKINLKEKVALVSYHPETLNRKNNNKNFLEVLKALRELKNFTIIFTMPNADIGYNFIYSEIKKFIKSNNNSYFFKSLGHEKFFSLCKNSDIMIGNSSSGIIEMPSFKKPSINIGSRQEGRVASKSVVNVNHNKKEILKKINYAISKNFNKKIRKFKNPYHKPFTSKKIVKIIKNINLDKILIKKFMDV